MLLLIGRGRDGRSAPGRCCGAVPSAPSVAPVRPAGTRRFVPGGRPAGARSPAGSSAPRPDLADAPWRRPPSRAPGSECMATHVTATTPPTKTCSAGIDDSRGQARGRLPFRERRTRRRKRGDRSPEVVGKKRASHAGPTPHRPDRAVLFGSLGEAGRTTDCQWCTRSMIADKKVPRAATAGGAGGGKPSQGGSCALKAERQPWLP